MLSKGQKKNIFLILGSFLLGFITWKYAVLRTLQVNSEIAEVQNELAFIPTEEKVLGIIRQNKELDTILQEKNGGTLHSSILMSIDKLTENGKVEILAFNEPISFRNNNSLYNTSYIIRLQGLYKDLEKAILNLENSSLGGAIRSLKYQKIQDYNTQKKHLECELIISFVRKNMIK